MKLNLKIILLLILLCSYSVRLWRLSFPAEYYFDEVYHAFTADAYARNDPRGYEWWHTSPIEGTAYEWLHPPVSKLFMGLSIYLLGNNSFAWRLPSAVFGTLVIYATYLLARALSKKKSIGILAAFIVSLDGLLLTQSRIAMNDAFVTFFIIMALYCYWIFNARIKTNHKHDNTKATLALLGSGLLTGLAVSSKWSGVFILPVIGLWEIYETLVKKKYFRLQLWPALAIIYVIIPACIYVLSFTQFFLQGHTLEQFKHLHEQIWWYQTNLEATHPYQSRPWQWMLNLKPVWFFVRYSEGQIANIYALANPAIAWLGLVAIAWSLYKGITKRIGRLFLVIAYFSVWAFWWFSPRIMFFYHYLPAIPLLSIALAWSIDDLWMKKQQLYYLLAVGIVSLIVMNFVYFFPHWTAVSVPESFAQQFYWFESWR